MSVVCCQEKVSEMGQSCIHRSPTGGVWVTEHDQVQQQQSTPKMGMEKEVRIRKKKELSIIKEYLGMSNVGCHVVIQK